MFRIAPDPLHSARSSDMWLRPLGGWLEATCSHSLIPTRGMGATHQKARVKQQQLSRSGARSARLTRELIDHLEFV